MGNKANEKEVVLTEEQKLEAEKIREADLDEKQKRYIALAEEFKEAMWDGSESRSDKDLFGVIRFCLYKLASRLGATPEFRAAFGNNFDSSDYPD